MADPLPGCSLRCSRSVHPSFRHTSRAPVAGRARSRPVLCRWQTADEKPERTAQEGVASPSSSQPEQASTCPRDYRTRLALERLYQLSSHPDVAPKALTDLLAPGLFLVTVGDPPPGVSKEQEERSPDYYANVGDAIRTLREDIPHLFERELNYSIYREDITFRDPRNTFSGISNYRLIFWSLRFHGRIFFSRLYVEVRRIWQPEDGTIRMRWTVRGVPRVPWEAEGTFDGISTYRLDAHGQIYEHQVDNVILRDPPMQGVSPLLYGLNLMPATPQQQACPGAWGASAAAALPAAPPAAAAAAASVGASVAHAAHAGRLEGRGVSTRGRCGTICGAASSAAGGSSAEVHESWWVWLQRFSWVRFYAALQTTMRLQAGECDGMAAPAEG